MSARLLVDERQAEQHESLSAVGDQIRGLLADRVGTGCTTAGPGRVPG